MSVTHPNNNFDCLRFLAAVFVWYSHCFAFMGGIPDPLTQLVPNQNFGGLGVAMFFIISGYFITMSYERHGRELPFLRNRALRILPALFTVVLLSVFLLGPIVTTLPFTAYMHDAQTWRYLRNLLIFPLQYDLPGVFQELKPTAVNASLWTLSHETRCYIVIALLGLLGMLKPRVMVALFAFLVSIMVYGAICGDTPPEKLFTVRWVKLQQAVQLGVLFSGGAVMYLSRAYIPHHSSFFCGALLILVAACTALPAVWQTIIVDIALIYMVIYLGFLPLPLVPHFGRFGDFSYGFYLYAFPMQQLTLHLLQGNKTPMGLFMLTSFVATLICAIASWHLIEKPALRYKA